MEQIYKKKVMEELDEDFANADPYGRIKIGTQNFFWRRGLRWYYIAAGEIRQVYRQIQQVESFTSCCENDFSIHRLIMITNEDREISAMMGDSFYRREPEMMMEAIARIHPTIVQMAPKRQKK